MVGTAFGEAEDFGVLAAEYETLTQVAQQHRFEELLGYSGQASDENASRTPAAPSSQLSETPTFRNRIESYGDEHPKRSTSGASPRLPGERRGASAVTTGSATPAWAAPKLVNGVGRYHDPGNTAVPEHSL
jgi:hypothetical protein